MRMMLMADLCLPIGGRPLITWPAGWKMQGSTQMQI